MVAPHLTALDAHQRRLVALRAAVQDAELVPRNERIFREVASLSTALREARNALWDDVAQTGLVSAEALDGERVRDLPR
jgi:hypothetical protein